ncbi:hypothetical protein MKL09_12810 [Methylobacterium sp. J-048]|uniref:hypothetical protein n=1 Tax=Methylobacterium sp. J-048 TaxID=2836635 RepID=UPI001FBA378F|nr:hypothetical protein [Methylobacterium sp. J-048]MCJ2057438.1 hypothetical protein [Methylobacterium sp. J-048]
MREVIITPDLHYIVVRDRLWRRANPHLSEEHRAALVARLMDARRAVKAAKVIERAGDPEAAAAMKAARAEVNAAKTALGERGPVWWTDGAPDLNRHLVRNTPYAAWFASLNGAEPAP